MDDLPVTNLSVLAASLPGADVLAMLLADKRNENTRRAYRHDVREFFLATYQTEPTPEQMQQFFALDTQSMAVLILRYKAELIQAQLSEATVNRRLTAILALVKMARRVGATRADPSDHVDSEKTRAYRDTRGITTAQARKLLAVPDRQTPSGRRDFALLLLLLENALRRAEIAALRVGDFDPATARLHIRGKGRGTQQEPITLSAACVAALTAYLEKEARLDKPALPLFVNCSSAARDKALTPDGIYKIVRELAKQAEIPGILSPHRLRHTAITMALDAVAGDVRRVQRLSRHARLETLQIYDDNRQDLQGEVTGLLSEILHSNEGLEPESGS